MFLRFSYSGYTISLVSFGGCDLLIGFLAFRSTFIPRPIGVLMMITGVAWLTFVVPDLAAKLVPYNVVAAAIGEVSMIVCLLVKGVNERRWLESAQLST